MISALKKEALPYNGRLAALIDGVKITWPKGGGSRFAKRVSMSSGTTAAAEVSTPIPYIEGAHLPRLPWRRPTVAEERLLWTEAPSDPANYVAVVRPDPVILDAFRALGIERVASGRELDALLKTDHGQVVLSSAVSLLERYLSPGRRRTGTCVIINRPKLPAVTYDPANRGHIGLHFDSWDKGPLLDRHLATNRICLNLGREDRHFLFVNLSVRQIIGALVAQDGESAQDLETWHPYKLAREFLARNPDYPVARLRVHPGEAYIAPTENIIHDGSTEDNDRLDFHLTVRGAFTCRPEP